MGEMWRRVCLALILGVAALVGGCGGGGSGAGNEASGGGGTTPDETFSASFTPATVQVEGVQGSPATVALSAKLHYEGASALYLGVGYDEPLVLDVDGYVDENDTLQLAVTMRGDVDPGDHQTELTLYACYDEQCARSAPGSPVKVAVTYRVTPGLQVQRQVQLERTGAEAAPTLTVPVTIPAAAGTLTMDYPGVDSLAAVQATFDGQALHFTTRDVRAGTYTGKVTLRSLSDPRYVATVDVTYVVKPPPGGEVPLSVVVEGGNAAVRQGQKVTRRLTITRPSWTNAWFDPELLSFYADHFTLVAAGTDAYDLTFDSTGLVPGSYSSNVRFVAGTTGGEATVYFAVDVGASVVLEGTFGRALSATSGAADLAFSLVVRDPEGDGTAWTAVSKTAGLQVLRSSGRTGVDSLELAVDPAVLASPQALLEFGVEVAVDRPGTAAQVFTVVLQNNLPSLQRASPGTLVGRSGRVYVEGAYSVWDSQLLAPGVLQVTGATLDKASWITDTRFVGDVSLLALDLAGATPGQPVTIRAVSGLATAQVQVDVIAALQASGFQALPYAAYRPGRYVPGAGAFYFAGPGVVYRWGRDGSSWQLTQSSRPGLLDVTAMPDGASLVGLEPPQVVSLDPRTLGVLSSGTFGANLFFQDALDTSAMTGLNAIVFSADARALASLKTQPETDNHGVAWICTPQTTRALAALTQAPVECEPGISPRTTGSTVGWGLVRSANGQSVVAVSPTGVRVSYAAAQRRWSAGTALPAGMAIDAVADDGRRAVRSDGMVLDAADTPLGSLGSAIPLTHVAGGFGLTSDGRFGLVYGYRLTGSGNAQRATDARLLVVDLRDVVTGGAGSAPVVANVVLSSAVGCTAATVDGERCEHRAALTTAPGDGTVFLVGPRGVAAVALPDALITGQVAAGMRPAGAMKGVRRERGGAK